MATIDFQHLSLLITLFAAALTSSVNAGPDVTSSIPSIHGSDSPPKSSSPTEYSSDVVDDKNASWNTSKIHLSEGGPVSISTIIQHANLESSSDELNKPDEEPKTRENVPKERNDSPIVVPRKEKIKPRKGVDQMDPQMTNMFNQTTLENTKPVMETASAETAHVNSQSQTSTIDTLKLNITNSHINNSLDRNTNLSTSYFNTSLIPTNLPTFHTETVNHTTPKTSLHIEKHIPKPKPTVTTVDGPDPNESRLSSRTKNPPLGMPRKIDYIVPVIITIIALPILGAAIFVLYRRGRDCWDKRHYRRMDFLIDGMYND